MNSLVQDKIYSYNKYSKLLWEGFKKKKSFLYEISFA